MSAGKISPLFGLPPEDPRKIEFVLNLLAKTQEGKVSWVDKGNAFTSVIPDGITVNFVVGTSLFGTGASWQLFTVWDRSGNVLIQVRSTQLIAPVLEQSTPALVEATDRLFAAVSRTPGDGLGRAIESLKKL